MESELYKSSHHADRFDGIPFMDLYAASNRHISLSILSRLMKEKDFLETGLANCVTYLHVLRQKQAHNYQRLNQKPSPSRKKRKGYQQTNHILDKKIKGLERDEKAFFNNLQACEANIYVAEVLAYLSIDVSSSVPDSASTPTQRSYTESELTESSWSGWANETSSPFQKQTELPFVIDELVTDAHADDLHDTVVVLKDIKRPPPLSRITEEEVVFLPVPPNTAHSEFFTISLDPGAAVFEPGTAVFEPGFAIEMLGMSSPPAERRCTNARLPSQIQDEPIPESAKVSNNAQQRDPKGSVICTSVGRGRSNSI